MYNSKFQIYRSGALGKRGLRKVKSYLQKRSMLFPKTIIYMNKAGYKFPFYYALDEYHLQKKYGFKFYHSFGLLRTYLDGRDPYHPETDIDKKNPLGRRARRIFPIRDDGLDGGTDSLKRILSLILDPDNQPVLFHCQGGRHRTGMIAMLIRYLQGGWWLTGEKKKRYGITLNPAQFEYYRFNHLMFRKSNIEFVEKFVQEEYFNNLKEVYSHSLQSKLP